MGTFMLCALTKGVTGLFSWRLAVSNSEPATRSEMSQAYSSSYFTAPLNNLGKTYEKKNTNMFLKSLGTRENKRDLIEVKVSLCSQVC